MDRRLFLASALLAAATALRRARADHAAGHAACEATDRGRSRAHRQHAERRRPRRPEARDHVGRSGDRGDGEEGRSRARSRRTFIGIATRTAADGKQTALEVLVFPEAMRGAGEGHYAVGSGARQHDDQRHGEGRGDGASGARTDGRLQGQAAAPTRPTP